MSYTKPNEFFKKIICINLDRRTDRWTECDAEFKKHHLVVERMSAVDGTTLPPMGRLTPGEIGCRASHIAALTVAAKCDGPVLILEDDVAFQDHFIDFFALHIMQLPPWFMLYLGGNHVIAPTKVPNHPVSRLKRTFTTSSYAVTPASAKDLLAALGSYPMQIDVAYAQVQPRQACYAFTPALAWQRPSYSDIQGENVNYKKNMI